MKFRYRQPVLHGEHACGMAQDPLSLGERARQHARVVRQEDTGKAEGASHIEEAGRLVGRRAVNGSRHHLRVVGNDGDALPAQTGQNSDDGSAECRLDREKRPFVDQRFEHRRRWDTDDGGSWE